MDVKVTVKQDAQIPKFNISFRDLNYSVYCDKEEKCVLKNISGRFKGGQLSAILGPSGSGKTTLLNILAGYKINKASGIVCMNNQSRILQHFYKISRYIMQENLLQPYLTVLESMMIAADFKLDFRVTKEEKLQIVMNILKTLGLTLVKNNRTEKLSGGERKRLAIALELINNPYIIFLDEPTSGLDEQASFQCLSALKQLAEEGGTVICSIHAPSAKAFALFDHVYIVTDGQCVFQGQGDQILPFLEEEQLTCPLYYNPIDFFIDVASGEYGPYIHNLVNLTENGKLCYPCEKEIENYDSLISDEKSVSLETIPEYCTSTLSQLKVLLYRKILQSCRNTMEIKVKCLMYSIMITIFCLLYYNCGNDATKIFTNMSFINFSTIALIYFSTMPPLIHYPIEIKQIQSEYFNRWYNIPAYFLANTLAVIPGFVLYTTLFICVTYPITDQPLAVDRIFKFMVICAIVNMIADANSMIVASVFSAVNSFFLGVAVMILPIMLAVFGYGYPFHLQPIYVKLMLRSSFMRYAVEALVDVIYDDRPEHLNCPDSEILCPLTSPKVIMQVLGYGSADYWVCLSVLIVFYVVCKGAHYFMLTQRLRPGKPAQMALSAVAFGKRLLVKYIP